jgi:carboxyl-terminal processing protease
VHPLSLLRALVLLFAIVGTPLQPALAAATSVSLHAQATEESSTQVRTVETAFNLLMDRYVQPLDSSAMLRAAWAELDKDATGKAAAPGPAPMFTGDRTADFEILRQALESYIERQNAQDGFVASHAVVRGMVRFVNEGHTYFLDPQQYQDYQSWARGDNRYVGIGISVTARDNVPRIVEVYEDTPAQKGGLRSGDVLVRINGQDVAGLALDALTGMVRGPKGSTVELVVRRADEPQLLTFQLERAEIKIQFVKQRVVGEDIGYVHLRGFPEPSVVEAIERNVANFQELGVRGLVLDLRGNSGGRIDVGTRLLSHFLPPGTNIFEEIDRSGHNRTHVTRSGSQYGLPLVVLVDGGTASMGEIFASAVKEHGAATVLGTTTAGSVAAAQVFALPDGAGLQVTVYEILSADGKQLNRIGVVPDEVIEAMPGDVAAGADPVLARAIEILHDTPLT